MGLFWQHRNKGRVTRLEYTVRMLSMGVSYACTIYEIILPPYSGTLLSDLLYIIFNSVNHRHGFSNLGDRLGCIILQ